MKEMRSSKFGGPGIRQRREMVILDKDGNEIPVRLYAALLYEDGQRSRLSGNNYRPKRDEKRLERQLLRSEKLASLGKLAAGIAHEINQPLTGVLTFAHLLKKEISKRRTNSQGFGSHSQRDNSN